MEPVVLEEKPPNKLAYVSLILSLLSAIAFARWLIFPDNIFFFIPIITGLISGIIGNRSIRQIKAKNTPGIFIAIAGVVLGCLPFIFSCGSLILTVLLH